MCVGERQTEQERQRETERIKVHKVYSMTVKHLKLAYIQFTGVFCFVGAIIPPLQTTCNHSHKLSWGTLGNGTIDPPRDENQRLLIIIIN